VENVESGAAATGTVLSGGLQVVMKGGIANGAVVSSGALEIVSGTASGTVVSDGGSATVASGGTANGVTIDSGGHLLVSSGGAVSGATLSGGILRIAIGGLASSSTITFDGGGTLVLDDTKFRGKIAGFDSPAETIDLTTVTFASATLGYTGNTLSGTLTVTDGTHTARLAMLGSYVAANFHLADDTHGGTLVFDPPVSSGSSIASPH
jgi:autotransporter passenger strand-loop-strand repeat protein